MPQITIEIVDLASLILARSRQSLILSARGILARNSAPDWGRWIIKGGRRNDRRPCTDNDEGASLQIPDS